MAGTLCALAPATVAALDGRANRDGTARQSTITTVEYTRASRVRAWSPNLPIICKSKQAVVCFAGKTPDDFSKKDGKEQSEGEFVAPRVTPDYVGKDSIKPPPRVTKNLEGPQITGWGGNVRGGKYEMGQGTDRIIDIFANGNAMLVAAGGLLLLFFVLLQFRPDAPPPPPPPSY